MNVISSRATAWWSGLADRQRRVATGLVLIGLLYTAHYLIYCIPQPFYIEDAAISFAYARNLVDGSGLATYAGGPRVEGYSNPSWTFLVAGLYALGLPLFTTAKVLGWLFGMATLPLAWALTRRALPDRDDTPFHPDFMALIAPFGLAMSVQFTVWNSSGLENSLFCFLLTLGLYRCVVELEDGGKPYSALVFFLLCASRPEGIMYALIALGLRAWHALFSSEGRQSTVGQRLWLVGSWVLVLLVPLVAYHAWRYWYFAWEFPNTYYAKLGTGRSFKPFSWTRKGWKYINAWAGPHGAAFLLPVVAVGLMGLGRRMRWAVVGLLAVYGVLLGWDGKEGLDVTPAWWSKVSGAWVKTRVLALAALVPLFWFASLRSRAWRARGVMWLCAAAGLFFVVYVGGDWMKAHRWFNLFSVALVGTAAVALTEVVWMIAGSAGAGAPRLTPRHLLKSRAVYATLALGLGAGAWGVNEARLSAQFFGNPETSVRDIHRRVMYMKGVQERLDLDHVTLLDVDMGAHMFYTDWAIVDIAGLVDVPMARHSDFNKRFLREYLFEERRPDFAHVHGGWARASRIPKIKEFPDRYIEIPGYPIGTRKLHIGNHINKNIFVRTDDQRPPLADFEGGISLVSVDIPAPLVQPGARVFVDTAWRAPLRKAGFRILVALTAADGTRAVSSFAPGYGWYDPKEWKRSETVTTKLRVTVPKTFPEGEASVSFALLDESSGKALGVVAEDSTAHPWMSGAYDWSGPVEVGDADTVEAEAESDRLAALELAEASACEKAWLSWKNAVRHRPFRKDYRDAHDGAMRSAIATCYARRAEGIADDTARAEALIAGLRWDHGAPEVVALARPLAEAMESRGDALWASEELEEAYQAFKTSIELDPRRSWARRKAEDVRDLRLKITRPGRKKKGSRR